VLLMHGTRDVIVPVHHGRQVAEANPKFHYWYCEGAEHCQLWDKDREGFESRVLDFFAKHGKHQ